MRETNPISNFTDRKDTLSRALILYLWSSLLRVDLEINESALEYNFGNALVVKHSLIEMECANSFEDGGFMVIISSYQTTLPLSGVGVDSLASNRVFSYHSPYHSPFGLHVFLEFQVWLLSSCNSTTHFVGCR